MLGYVQKDAAQGHHERRTHNISTAEQASIQAVAVAYCLKLAAACDLQLRHCETVKTTDKALGQQRPLRDASPAGNNRSRIPCGGLRPPAPPGFHFVPSHIFFLYLAVSTAISFVIIFGRGAPAPLHPPAGGFAPWSPRFQFLRGLPPPAPLLTFSTRVSLGSASENFRRAEGLPIVPRVPYLPALSRHPMMYLLVQYLSE